MTNIKHRERGVGGFFCQIVNSELSTEHPALTVPNVPLWTAMVFLQYHHLAQCELPLRKYNYSRVPMFVYLDVRGFDLS
jgi:hypothetical protein